MRKTRTEMSSSGDRSGGDGTLGLREQGLFSPSPPAFVEDDKLSSPQPNRHSLARPVSSVHLRNDVGFSEGPYDQDGHHRGPGLNRRRGFHRRGLPSRQQEMG